MEQVLGRLEIIRKYVNNHNHKATRTVTTYLLFVHAKRRFYIGYGTDDDMYVSANRTIHTLCEPVKTSWSNRNQDAITHHSPYSIRYVDLVCLVGHYIWYRTILSSSSQSTRQGRWIMYLSTYIYVHTFSLSMVRYICIYWMAHGRAWHASISCWIGPLVPQ